MSHSPFLRLCAHCRRPLGARVAPEITHCDAPACVTRSKVLQSAARAKKPNEFEEDLRERSLMRVAETIDAAKDRLRASDPTARNATIVADLAPYIAPPLEPLAEDRRAAFEAHLEDILDAAFVYGPPAPTPKQGWETISDRDLATRQHQVDDEPLTLTAACIACQGKCCMQAYGTQAFLTVHTIRAVRAQDPEITRDAIRDAYLSRLPEASIVRSCVYHGPRGCTLPREIRAGVCNRWECGHRKRLREQIAETGARHVVVVGLAEDHTKSPEAGADVIRVVTASETDFEVHADLRPGALPARPPMALRDGQIRPRRF